jgi:hypothetical protein
MDAVPQWLSSALALLPAGLIAGFGIGAGTEAVKWLKESSQRRREQRDAGEAAALELVPLLTKFARECDSRWCWNEYQEPCYCDMPKLPAFRDNLTWTALPQKTAGAIRALPNEIDDAESDIKSRNTLASATKAHRGVTSSLAIGPRSSRMTSAITSAKDDTRAPPNTISSRT